MDKPHIRWARKVQAIAQVGLEYSESPYDLERYEELRLLAADMMAECSDIPTEQWLGRFADETGYATPKVDVRGAAFKGNEVLLSRERDDGLWSLPGGWADVNDTPSQAVIRELKEETGYTVSAVRLIAVLDRDLHYPGGQNPFHIYKLMFLCELSGEADALCHDIEESRFFPVDDLPQLSLHRTLPQHIQLLYEHQLNPGLPVVVD